MRTKIDDLLEMVNFACNTVDGLGPIASIVAGSQFNTDSCERLTIDIVHGRFDDIYGASIDKDHFANVDDAMASSRLAGKENVSTFDDLDRTIAFALKFADLMFSKLEKMENFYLVAEDFLEGKLNSAFGKVPWNAEQREATLAMVQAKHLDYRVKLEQEKLVAVTSN